MYNKEFNEIKRLNLENIIWIFFIVLSALNIVGDNEEKKYLETHQENYHNLSNHIFLLTIVLTLFIYIYFFYRNYKAYKEANTKDKQLFLIKLLGSSFLIAGVICLIYFQSKQTNFIGSPAI